MSRIYNQYVKIQSEATCNDSGFKPIEIMNIFTAFLLLIIGAVSACIMVLLELQYKHYLKQKQIDDFSKSRIIKVQMNRNEINSRNSDLGKNICTMLQKFSKFEVKAAFCGNFTILLQLMFYGKSHIGVL